MGSQHARRNQRIFYTGLKPIGLWIIFQLLTNCVMAQGATTTDSLARLVPLAKSDTAKAMLLYQLGDEWSLRDSAKGLQYLREGMRIAKQYPFYQAIGYFYLGRVYMDYDRPKAGAIFDQAIRLFDRYPSKASYLYQSRAWGNKGSLAQLNNDNNQLIALILNKAIPLAAKAGDSIQIAVQFANIAITFMNIEDNNKAIYYLNQSIRIFRRLIPVDLRQADNFACLSRLYLRINDLLRAKNSLDSSYHILQLHPASLYTAYYFTAEGMYYIKKKDWDKAEKSIDNGLAVAEQLNSRQDIHVLLYQKARVYDLMHKPKKVKRILLKLLNEGYVRMDLDRKQIMHDMAYTESELGNTKAAYDWMLQYSNLADSIYQKDSRLKVAAFETRFNYAEKEKELLIVNNRSRIQQLIMWTSLLGLLAAITFFLILYRLHRSRARQQQQAAVAQALLVGEEKERTRVARDLHDGLGGMLAGVKINLTDALQENATARTDRVIRQLDNSVMELRRIARNLMPEALLRSGLQAALTDLCTSLVTDRLNLEFRFMNIATDLPMQIQTIIYRIVQELLANIIKHSEATDAFVQCSQNANLFFITVEDNGKGLNKTGDRSPGGLGLESIKSRVIFLNGTLDISSRSGKGTVVNIELKTDGKS